MNKTITIQFDYEDSHQLDAIANLLDTLPYIVDNVSVKVSQDEELLDTEALYDLMNEVSGFADRKVDGGDVTEDESATIKRYFDYFHPEVTGGFIAELFPLEADEWKYEREEGYR